MKLIANSCFVHKFTTSYREGGHIILHASENHSHSDFPQMSLKHTTNVASFQNYFKPLIPAIIALLNANVIHD